MSKVANLDIEPKKQTKNEEVKAEIPEKESLPAKEEVQVEEPIKEEAPVEDVQDIMIPVAKKKRFRINGDNRYIVELNTSDLGIVTRYSKLYPKLQELTSKAATIGTETEDEEGSGLDNLGEKLAEIDTEMRSVIDELFESNVSEMCAPYGNMYDPVDGMFRYESILENLLKLYTTTINNEVSKIKKRVHKHTDKYIGR